MRSRRRGKLGGRGEGKKAGSSVKIDRREAQGYRRMNGNLQLLRVEGCIFRKSQRPGMRETHRNECE